MSWTDFHRSQKKSMGGPHEPISRNMVLLSHPIGSGLLEIYDLGKEEILTVHDILDLMALHDKSEITITFDKVFLKKILKSHIKQIRFMCQQK